MSDINSNNTDAILGLDTKFGSGLLGNVTISSGVTTAADDMHFRNLTMSGTGQLSSIAWRVFVSENLDLTSAAANALNANGAPASGVTAGAAVTVQTISGNTAGGNGGAGGVPGGGSTGATATSPTGGNAGRSGAAGAGGIAFTGHTVAQGGNARTAIFNEPIGRYMVELIRLVTTYNSGPGGSGGGGGEGDFVSGNGGNGGGGGAGSGILYLAARTIIRGAGTATGALAAIPGVSTAGTNGTLGSTAGGGGGGGASGGGGGWVMIMYGNLSGSVKTNCINVSGGDGQNGGTGAGIISGNNGTGGDGGGGGRITLYNISNNTGSDVIGTTGTAHSGQTGGPGQSFMGDL